MKNKQSLFLSKKKLLKEAGCLDYKESAKRLFSKALVMSLAQSYKSQIDEKSNKRLAYSQKWSISEQWACQPLKLSAQGLSGRMTSMLMGPYWIQGLRVN